MFDDQQPQVAPPSAGAPRASSKTAPPPEDIFSGTDAVSEPPVPTPPAPVVAPGGDVPVPAPTNPVLDPTNEKPLPAGLGEGESFSRPPSAVMPAVEERPRPGAHHASTIKKMSIIGVIAVLVVIAAVLLAQLVLRSRQAVDSLAEPTETPKTQSLTTPIEDLIPSAGNLPGSTSPIVENDLLLGGDPVPPPVPVDSDRDGLTDEEELALGTSPRSSDTDADGLSDRDEVQLWSTNPLNADTDGDGFMDGEEVDNGYNPRGAGKLFELPSGS